MLLSALCAVILFIKILQSAACKEYIGKNYSCSACKIFSNILSM